MAWGHGLDGWSDAIFSVQIKHNMSVSSSNEHARLNQPSVEDSEPSAESGTQSEADEAALQSETKANKDADSRALEDSDALDESDAESAESCVCISVAILIQGALGQSRPTQLIAKGQVIRARSTARGDASSSRPVVERFLVQFL